MAHTYLYDLQVGGDPRGFTGNSYVYTPAILSPDSRFLFMAHSLEGGGTLIDTETSLPVPTEESMGALRPGQAAAFAPKGRLLSSANDGGTIKLWSIPEGRVLGELESGDGGTFALAFSGDGRLLLSGGVDGSVRVWETATRSERFRLPADKGPVHAIALSPDGRTIASAGRSGRIFLRDLYHHRGCIGKPEASFDELWKDLGAADAGKGYCAMSRFMISPEIAIPLVAARLRPAAAVDPTRMQQLLADVQHRRYTIRQAALHDLRALGSLAAPALSEAAKSGASPELRKRAAELLHEIVAAPPTEERLLAARVIEMLEQLATPAARQQIERLASGTPNAEITEAARLALRRMEGKRNR